MSKTLKQTASLVASDYGFSSLQEIVRVILNKLARKELVISIAEEKTVRLSARAEKRYAKMMEDVQKGKNVTVTNNLEEFLKLLK